MIELSQPRRSDLIPSGETSRITVQAPSRQIAAAVRSRQSQINRWRAWVDIPKALDEFVEACVPLAPSQDHGAVGRLLEDLIGHDDFASRR